MNTRIASLIFAMSLFGCSSPADPEPHVFAAPTAHPPMRPDAHPTTGATRWFVISHFDLGITTRDGKVDPTAWSTYGYDLDGRWTTVEESATSLGTCKRMKGSWQKALVDGQGGVDNNFGQHFMSVVKSLKSDVEDVVDERLTNGEGPTMLLRLDHVEADDDAAVPGALYRVAPSKLDVPHLPIDASSVDGEGAPIVTFPHGYMSGGTWVSGDFDGRFTVAMPAPFGDVAEIPLDSAVLSFDVKTGKNGVIAGASEIAALRAGLTPALRAGGFCDGQPSSEQIWLTMTESADLSVEHGATTLDETVECNAISVGIGFEVLPTDAPGDIVKVPVSPSHDCKTEAHG